MTELWTAFELASIPFLCGTVCGWILRENKWDLFYLFSPEKNTQVKMAIDIDGVEEGKRSIRRRERDRVRYGSH